MANKEPAGFARYRDRAARLANDLDKVERVAQEAQQKLADREGMSGKFRAVRDDLADFLELLKAYASGSYREVPKAALISVLGAVLYFLMPLDVVPDFLFGLGLLDDAAVIGFVLGQFRSEIERFRSFREGRGGTDETSG